MRSTDHSLLLTIILRNVRNDLQTALFFYLRPAGRLSADGGLLRVDEAFAGARRGPLCRRGLRYVPLGRCVP